MNRFWEKYGVAIIGALVASQCFFIVDLIHTVKESSQSVTQMQEKMRSLESSHAGIMELRVDVAVLKSNVNELRNQFDDYLHGRKK